MTTRHLSIASALSVALSTATASVVGPSPGTIVDGAQPASVMEVHSAGIGHVNLGMR